jgi:hypothetical protein
MPSENHVWLDGPLKPPLWLHREGTHPRNYRGHGGPVASKLTNHHAGQCTRAIWHLDRVINPVCTPSVGVSGNLLPTQPLIESGGFERATSMAQKPLTPSVTYISRIPEWAWSTYFRRMCAPLGETGTMVGKVRPKYELLNYGKRVLWCLTWPWWLGFVLSPPTTREWTLTHSTRYQVKE